MIMLCAMSSMNDLDRDYPRVVLVIRWVGFEALLWKGYGASWTRGQTIFAVPGDRN